MSEHDALLQGILDRPDDDAPRLVYADWLEEHGNPERAAFIRLQCEAARLPLYEPRRARCEGEAAALLAVHDRPGASDSWGLPFLAELMPEPAQVYRRGFVERLSLTDRQFLDAAGRCWPATPLREVHFTEFGVRPDLLIHSSHLARLTRVNLAGNQALAYAGAELLRTIRLPRLAGLGLANTNVPGAAVAALGELAELPGLRELDLSRNPFTPDDVRELAGAAFLEQLTELRLDADRDAPYSARLRAVGAGELARSRHLWNLRSLSLAGQLIGDAGLRSLAESPAVRALEVLNLQHNDVGSIGDSGLDALAGSRLLRNLRVLTLADNPIGDAFPALLDWPGLRELRFLDLAWCGLTDRHLRRLAEPGVLGDGVRLDLAGNAASRPVARRLRERFGERVAVDEPP